MRFVIAIIVILAAVSAIIMISIPKEAPEGYTGLSLLQGSDADEIEFSIANHEGKVASYDYIIEQTSFDGLVTSTIGQAALEDGKDAIISFPLEDTTTAVIVSIPRTDQRISFETGRTKEVILKKKEWKPEIVPDLPWERQDPMVRHFYRYVYEESRTYEHERA